MKKTGTTPDYLQTFECTGSACEDTCCFGWGVNIDKRTFSKYKELPDKKWKRSLTQHISRNKSETTFASYAMIKMADSGYCPFLNKDRLCSVQLSLGSSYLSQTCASYPRQVNKVYDTYETSATISCPEVARLTLLNPGGLTFSPTRVEVEKNPLVDKLVEEEGFANSFTEIRALIIALLQNRSHSVNTRLLMLGFLLKELQEASEEEGDESILRTLAHWQSVITSQDWLKQVKDLPVDPLEQFQILVSIVEEYLEHTEVTSQRYLQLYQESAEGTQYDAETYQKAYEQIFQPFFQEHNYIMENYLVHYVFSQLFPFSLLSESLYANYVVLVLHYALIRFHLIGIAAYHQGLTPELVISVVYSFARTYEHDNSFFKNALAHLREEEWDSMAYMSVLIENGKNRA